MQQKSMQTLNIPSSPNTNLYHQEEDSVNQTAWNCPVSPKLLRANAKCYNTINAKCYNTADAKRYNTTDAKCYNTADAKCYNTIHT